MAKGGTLWYVSSYLFGGRQDFGFHARRAEVLRFRALLGFCKDLVREGAESTWVLWFVLRMLRNTSAWKWWGGAQDHTKCPDIPLRAPQGRDWRAEVDLGVFRVLEL